MNKRSVLLLWAPFLLSHGLTVPRHATLVSDSDVQSQEYDFIVAGGGVAGLTVADRLTEIPDVSVLVIETGPVDQDEDFIYIPGSYDLQPYAWPSLTTEPIEELNNRVFDAVIARVAGGASVINAMNFVRGTALDYDGWESLGNDGWGWEDLLPYFIKSENFTEPTPQLAREGNITWDDSVRGHEGPIQYSYPTYVYPGLGALYEAALHIGIQPRLDPNAGHNAGIFEQPFAIDAATWTRSSAKRNHYDPAIGRPNYHFLADTTVARVIFDETQAIGVEYLPSAGGSTSRAYASKEVLIAAGALHTPQVLQLSGVGPRDLLESLDIPVVSDLPGVGSNLQDHTTLPQVYTWTHSITPNVTTFITNTTWADEQRALYDVGLPSVWSVTKHLAPKFVFVSYEDVTAGTAYANILADAEEHDPAESLPSDVHATVLAGYAAQRQLIFDEFRDPDLAIGNLGWDTDTNGQLFSVKPFSRGYVHINQTDPLANPVINYRTATDPADFPVLLALFRKQREMFAAPSLAALGPIELTPGPTVQTDEEVLATMREILEPSNGHQCCTAPMMPLDLGGVVSPELKVYGTAGLRVIDVSIMPKELSGPPMATVYAIGEKAADIIKAEYGLLE
ncbi:GMC family oxidoreductase [Aspergillus lucknowensis]|uniref:Glucose-methanol-choline oxidoreductase N-terminal domain-containing protein n=1 Tax=Aspergillus lucknowensis TaxID=176173 RepID=A0ABR4LFD1_9EURO